MRQIMPLHKVGDVELLFPVTFVARSSGNDNVYREHRPTPQKQENRYFRDMDDLEHLKPKKKAKIIQFPAKDNEE